MTPARRGLSAFKAAVFLALSLFPLQLKAQEPVEKFEQRPVRLPPFFWYERDAEADRRFLMAGLLYWDNRQADLSQRLLVPLFYRTRDAESRLLVTLPLYAAYRSLDLQWTLAGPYYMRRSSQGHRRIIFPLYWQHFRAGGGRTRALIPFIFYDYASHDKSNRDQFSLLGWRTQRGDTRTGIWLNYWWNETPESRFRVFFPLYWQMRSAVEKWDVFGPFYRHTELQEDPPSGHPEETRTRIGLFPLVGGGFGDAVSSHYLFPLYSYSRTPEKRWFMTIPFSRGRGEDLRQGHVGPYFYSRDPDLRIDGFFPLWYQRRATDGFERKAQVLNFFYSRENEDKFQTLFPLYGAWSDGRSSRFLSWGLWRRKDLNVDAGWAWLYFWKREDKDTTRVLFPLYWHFWREPDWGLDVIFPIYTRYRDGETTLTAIPPVIWKKTGDRTLWSFLFLYWRDVEPDRGSLTVVPFFHDNFDPHRRMFFSPLLWTRRSASSREGIFPPVYWYRSAEARRTWVVPVYWHTKKEKLNLAIVPPYYRWTTPTVTAQGLAPVWGTHRGEESRGSYVMPFYWHSGKGNGNGLWIVPPLLMYVTRSDAGTPEARFNMQYLLLGNVHKTPTALEHDFFPLYRYVRTESFVNWWAPRVLALAAYENNIAADSRKGYVFPYAWRRSPAADWNLLFPFLYQSHRYEVDVSSNDVQTRGRALSNTHIVFPLYWQGVREKSAFEYVVPLYIRYKDERKKIKALAPLWFSYDSPAQSKFRLFFPLYWRVALTREEDGTPSAELREPDAGRRPDKSIRKDIKVAGLFFRVDTKTPERTTRTVGLAPFFAKTDGGPGNRYYEILGGLFGRDVQNYERRFRIFWLFYTAPKPLRR